jgi:hypothetical protein
VRERADTGESRRLGGAQRAERIVEERSVENRQKREASKK